MSATARTQADSPAAAGAPLDRGLVRDTLGLGFSGALSAVLFALRGLIGARVLGPAGYGIWQAVRLALRFASLGDLGALEGLKREVPLARGAGDAARVSRVRGAALLMAHLPLAPIIPACAVGSIAAWAAGSRERAAAFAAAALAVLAQQLFAFANADLRAAARMKRSAAAGLSTALAGTAAAWPLARAFGPAGFVGAVALGSLAGLLVATGARPWRLLRLVPGAAARTVRDLVRLGFPIRLAQGAVTLRRSIDTFALLVLAGASAAGLYGLGNTLAGLLEVLPAALAAAVAPRALERFGRTKDPADLRRALGAPLDVLSRTVVPLAGLAAVLSEPAIGLAMPRFAAGVGAAKILALTALFAGFESLALTVAAALGRQRSAALVSVGLAVLAAALDAGLLLAGYGIVAVALVSIGIGAANGVALAFLADRWLGAAPRQSLRLLGPPLGRMAYGALVLGAVEWAGAAGLLPGGAAGRAVLALALTLPLLRGLRLP